MQVVLTFFNSSKNIFQQGEDSADVYFADVNNLL